MKQEELALAFGVWYAPQAVSASVILSLEAYRDAVRMAWATRRIKGMTQSHLASICGFYAPHVSHWLSKKEERAEMPAKHIARFEAIVGNTIVSQWLARQSKLTVLEELKVERDAA